MTSQPDRHPPRSSAIHRAKAEPASSRDESRSYGRGGDSFDAAIEELSTIRDLIRWGGSRFAEAGLFFGHGTDNALDEARWLVLHALSLPLDLADAYSDSCVTRDERAQVIELLRKRIETRKPAAYLTGEAWFCGLQFYVDENVLVPRSPIAELIESGFSPWLDGVDVENVLDLCTGSGCIGIATALAFPDAEVTLSDLSAEALAVATRNIARYHLEYRVTARQSDLFEQLPSCRYDLIVCNPPYVDAEDMAALPEEFRQEPSMGLEAGEYGLEIVDRIMLQAEDFLSDQGILVVEVGNSQAAMMDNYPDLPLVWLEFERGGHGVFLIKRSDLAGAKIEH